MTQAVTLRHTDSLVRFGHALSDETRARILLALCEGPSQPSQLADRLGVSRQKLSNHLGCLRGCGLVAATKEGRNTWYQLADKILVTALADLVRLALVVDPACCTDEGCGCS